MNEKQDEKENQTENSKLKWGCILEIAFVIVMIISVVFGFVYCDNHRNNPNKDGSLFTRPATANDISIESNNDFSLSINCKIKPNENIKNLQLTFSFLDNNINTLTTKIKTVGNVSKDTEYTISFSLSEFDLLDLFKIVQYTVQVTGGTVSIFA